MLALETVSKTYPNGTVALRDVALGVEQGEIVALVGGSGCGKTTLLRAVAGLDLPSSGNILLDGETIVAPHPSIGVIFQEPRLLPWLSVGDNVAFGISDRPAAERRERVGRILRRLGLEGYEARWPRELSGGQAQRVAIARALIARPKVLLLDEPFSALDAFTRASLHSLLIALWQAERPTLLLVTHDVDEAVTLGDRVVVLQPHPGRVFAEIRLSMPRPRDLLCDGARDARRAILAALDGSLQPARAEAPSQPEPIGGYW